VAGVLKRFEWLYHFLASKQLTLILFLILCIFLIPRTLRETTDISLGITGSIIFGFISLNLILCTLQRIKTLAKSVIVIHVGTLLTFAGVVISTFGYVATVNIHEGSSVDTVYRWDKEMDMPLGLNIKVKKINVEHYPFLLKVGVLRGEEKVGLFVLKTGERFQLDKYTVAADSVEFPSENLKLSVFNTDHFIGSAETEGTNNLPADFPYEFKLVAYRTPSVKRLWVDLALSKDSEVIAEGTSEVNRPLSWGKLNIYNTQAAADEYGQPYAGIQITNDPGIPYVYTGFVVLGIGTLMYMYRRLYGHR
jgi:hypothetical protein